MQQTYIFLSCQVLKLLLCLLLKHLSLLFCLFHVTLVHVSHLLQLCLVLILKTLDSGKKSRNVNFNILLENRVNSYFLLQLILALKLLFAGILLLQSSGHVDMSSGKIFFHLLQLFHKCLIKNS